MVVVVGKGRDDAGAQLVRVRVGQFKGGQFKGGRLLQMALGAELARAGDSPGKARRRSSSCHL
jgi:hypothetical protein